MLHQTLKLAALVLLMSLLSKSPALAQESLQREYNDSDQNGDQNSNQQENSRNYDRVRIDRYLNVEIWADHDDDEYYEGDRVKLNYRVSRDAFVAVYSIDSKGRVNMLFPSSPGQDNYVTGGVTYSLPGRDDDYDFVVNGPEGVENVQIIASREPFPIPDWYVNSGLFCDWEDRHEYMDWVNSEYFVKYDGQRFAYDRTALYIYEWEPNYFRPVYRPYYPNWTVSGNVYVDYWPGSSLYIDGIYWGCTPLYIPRVYCGWHTFTVYDRYNYGWEYDVHVTRYNTVVLNNTVIVTQPEFRSKYKTVRFAGYQDPVKAGYNDYNKELKTINQSGAWKNETVAKITSDSKQIETTKSVYVGEKKFVVGSSKVVKTDRGIETTGSPVEPGLGGNKSRHYGNGNSIEKKTIDYNSEGKKSHESIFKRTESNQPTEQNTVDGSGRHISRGEQSAIERRKSNENAPSGSYRKSGGSSSRKHSPSNDSGKSEEGKTRKEQSSPGSSKQQGSGHRPDNATMNSSGNRDSGGSNKGSSSSYKPNGPSKESSGGGKPRSGRR